MELEEEDLDIEYMERKIDEEEKQNRCIWNILQKTLNLGEHEVMI